MYPSAQAWVGLQALTDFNWLHELTRNSAFTWLGRQEYCVLRATFLGLAGVPVSAATQTKRSMMSFAESRHFQKPWSSSRQTGTIYSPTF
jgi:hypothetical protein